ncbi:Zn(II)2Cys6 transcription factor [Aspergillus homomorphus CBS 101889]|uniref:C6 zinc finger domain protein n=1 Tax=Aspergillus homomorphus (strain CBS 101889) TaxID=1450537 RepID=A0A395HGU7_ASPHC|nr:C6 zinc finger domain protein [Aspergillus homomorphus CBS 101889]RAL06719.1 C6 zinc finger domain protein [Aspergillus homomorphus CBS 101889]
MKRKATPESLNSQSKRAPRQDPVSCVSCRTKKIKCDRQQPCGSCSIRGLPCRYERSSATREDSKFQETHPAGHETSIITQKPQDNDSPVTISAVESRNNRELMQTADWLENIHMAARIPTVTPQWLRDGLGGPRSNRTPSSTPGAGLSPSSPAYPYMTWSASKENPATIDVRSYLPNRDKAMALLQYYIDYVGPLYHIIIASRVRSQVDNIYRSVELGSPIILDQLALLFSIMASSLYLQLSLESSADAEACSRELSYLTGATLIQSNYTVSPTIEGLQATMIVMHNLCTWNIQPSVSALFALGSIISQAKILMLHCVDLQRLREERKAVGYDSLEVELKRRLWWDLVSYDWLLGNLSGPQEWTYSIQQNHMNVQQPSNVDDTIIEKEGVVSSRPDSVPTDMSYALQRLKLAVICREIIDATSYDHLHGQELDYGRILELDRKFHHLISEIPEFFRLDPGSRRRFEPIYKERPAIAWQKYVLQQGYYSRLCRLHRHHFIRGAREPSYAYSHVICLQSARKVLEIKRIMDEGDLGRHPPISVVWSVIHHVFMAAVILLMDVCFNWDDILADKRKEEVLDACRMLSKAHESSLLVREGINAMMRVLQKHWKSGKQSFAAQPVEMSSSDTMLAPSLVEESACIVPVASGVYNMPSTTINVHGDSMEAVTTCLSGDKQLEDIWSEMLESGNNLALESSDWTDLLNELTDTSLPRNCPLTID